MEEDVTKVPVCYFKKDGVLMNKWRPPDVPADDEWKVHYQIVIPQLQHNEILSLVHRTPLAAHRGVNKTEQHLDTFILAKFAT